VGGGLAAKEESTHIIPLGGPPPLTEWDEPINSLRRGGEKVNSKRGRTHNKKERKKELKGDTYGDVLG